MTVDAIGPKNFRGVISSEPGAKFPPEKGRYHLYVALNCPWAQRTIISRKLKGLEDIISVDVVDWKITDKGWRFNTADHKVEGATEDSVHGKEFIRDIYFNTAPNYAGRFTVPVLYDKKTKTIVNNESSDIVTIFNTAFNSLLDEKHAALNFYPKQYKEELDDVIEWTLAGISNGFYPLFKLPVDEAERQSASKKFYSSLDRLEALLKEHAEKNGDPSKPVYLVENQITEADIRVYPALVRFDVANLVDNETYSRTIRSSYPYINKWLTHLYWDVPAFHDTTDFHHIGGAFAAKSGKKYDPSKVPVPILAKA